MACALECIHTYSLIHDDLPAMDNDDLRRGRPTNHKIYGEAAAILAGDSLLTYAFEILTGSRNKLSSEKKIVISNLIARASGPEGMAGGQSLDIANENQPYPFELLQTIHRSKTGALIKCSVRGWRHRRGRYPGTDSITSGNMAFRSGLLFRSSMTCWT